jgi:hypothetical protein
MDVAKRAPHDRPDPRLSGFFRPCKKIDTWGMEKVPGLLLVFEVPDAVLVVFGYVGELVDKLEGLAETLGGLLFELDVHGCKEFQALGDGVKALIYRAFWFFVRHADSMIRQICGIVGRV